MDVPNRLILHVGAYDAAFHALQDLDALEQLHAAELVGGYEAAVVDMARGRPRVVRSVDHPRVHAVPERLGSGPLPRSALKEAAKQLTGHDAALVVLGESTIAGGLERAMTRAGGVAEHDFDDTPDVIGTTLMEAFESARGLTYRAAS
jgi:hypothetical protein